VIHEIDIEFLNASGDGVGRLEHQQIIVPFTIPGERVRVRVDREERRRGVPGDREERRRGVPGDREERRQGVAGDNAHEPATGVLEAIVRASPHRVTPRCRHFGPEAEPGVGPCGGCAWQHIAYPEQLRLKTELVTRLVRAAVPQAPPAAPMLAGTALDDPWGYRHKVHFVFGSAGGSGGRGRPREGPSLVMGHFVRGTRRVIPVRECPVHVERGNGIAFQFLDEYLRAKIASAPDGVLKSLALRVADRSAELMATLVVTGDRDKALRGATRRLLQRADAPTSFHVNIHPKADGFVFGPETRRVTGRDRLREEVAGVAFLISPDAFFQTNVRAAEILVRLVMEAIPPDGNVLDLYAGSGLFALPLAQRGGTVTAVEENRAAVADGEASRGLNRISQERCRFVAVRAEQAALAVGLRTHDRRAQFDAVVLDPPREGCSAAVLDLVFSTVAPATVVYVSCHPEALARDLAAVAPLHYRIHSLQPVDMFPHTAHVETVAVLKRA
jgi:23S rRNA (uracil1939-C5)-methyltransferase